MKSKELAEKLLKYPDFEIDFCFSELDNSDYGMTVRVFNNIAIGDIGHSDKKIRLSGEEE